MRFINAEEKRQNIARVNTFLREAEEEKPSTGHSLLLEKAHKECR